MRRVPRIVLLLAVLAVVLGWAGVAAAAPAGGSPAGKQDRDVFELRGDLGIWTIVVFLGLFLILRKFAWGPILTGLHQREAGIKGAIAEAENLRAESARLRDQLAAEMAKAADKVREIMEEARRDAQHLTEEMIAKARTEISAERDRLYRELRLAQDIALKELWSQAANIAASISSKAIRRELSPADHERLLDEALAELGEAGIERQSVVSDVMA